MLMYDHSKIICDNLYSSNILVIHEQSINDEMINTTEGT